MLLDLRDGIRNSKWMKYVLVTIICIPFALFGINSYFGAGGYDNAAIVNGEKVSLRAYDNAYQVQRNQLRQAFGGRIPEGFNAAGMIGQQAMNTIVTREIIRQASNSNGLALGDEQLAQEITTSPMFNVDGRFDKERYQLQLQSQGMSAADFEVQYRSDLILQQFQQSVTGTSFGLESETAALASLQNQQRRLSTVTFELQKRADSIEVEDEAVQSHYDENTANFNNPQKVKVEYIELRVDDLAADVEVTEEDLQLYFEQVKREFRVPEKRDASHILLSLDADAGSSAVAEKEKLASELIARINGGEKLADLAEEFSDDPGSASSGGSLGSFERGVMVPPFEEAVFAMQVGDLSEAVRSDFGFHIIQLNEIVEEHGQSLEDVRSDLEKRYRDEEAERNFYEVSNDLSNASYENVDSLEPAADETGLEIKVSDWIDRNTRDGLGQYQQVLAAALTDDVLNNGQNSEVLEVGRNHAVVLRTVEHEVASPKLIDEVREQIVTEVQRERAQQQLNATADELVEKLRDGGDASALAKELDATFADEIPVARDGSDVDPAVVMALFKLPKPVEGENVLDAVTTGSGDVVVAIFSGLADADETPEESADVDEDASAGASPAPSQPEAPVADVGAAEFASMISTLEASAEVERNDALLSDLAN